MITRNEFELITIAKSIQPGDIISLKFSNSLADVKLIFQGFTEKSYLYRWSYRGAIEEDISFKLDGRSNDLIDIIKIEEL